MSRSQLMSAEKQIPTADERSSFGGGKSAQFGTLSWFWIPAMRRIRLMDLPPWEIARPSSSQ